MFYAGHSGFLVFLIIYSLFSKTVLRFEPHCLQTNSHTGVTFWQFPGGGSRFLWFSVYLSVCLCLSLSVSLPLHASFLFFLVLFDFCGLSQRFYPGKAITMTMLGVSVVSFLLLGGGSYPFSFCFVCLFGFSRKIVLRGVWAHNLHNSVLTSDTSCKFGVFQKPSHFRQFARRIHRAHWKRLLQIRLSQGRMQTRHSHGKMHTGQSPEKVPDTALTVSSAWVRTCHFLGIMCENMQLVLPIGEAHRSLWCAEVLLGLVAYCPRGWPLVIRPSQRSG